MITTIGFDADDTLWHNERLFVETHARFRGLLSRYHDSETVDKVLFQTEVQNLELFGYGIKAFALSAIETAIRLSDGRIPAEELLSLIEQAKDMLRHPVHLLDGVEETLPLLARQYELMIITKGDLLDQERKIAESGVASWFRHHEIVSDKTPEAYGRILRRHGIAPESFLMIGNSLRSDVLPVLHLGGFAAHLPYEVTWEHERVETMPADLLRFARIGSIREVPSLAGKLSAGKSPLPYDAS